jgi:ParB/RepB/Spo0J family partition protein
MLMEITTERLHDHPANREFATAGAGWDAFVASVKERGVIQPLLVRPRPTPPGGYQVVAGHRRRRAAMQAGLEAVPCLVKEITDREALEMLLIENLEREEINPVDEARGVAALIEECGMTEEEVAARLKRSREWVRTRQMVLELPEEAREALRLPKEHDGHLHVGTVQLLLALDSKEREMAVQMILHPDFQRRTLSPRQAEDAIKVVIVKPRKEREAWDGQREKLGKEWRTALRKRALTGTRDDVTVLVVGWEEAQAARPGRNAEEAVGLAETTPAAPLGLCWQHLATRHALAIRIVPAEDGESRAVVDELLLRNAEQALADHGKEQPWLAGRKKSVLVEPAEVTRAKAAMNEEPEHAEMVDGDEVRTVIEQTVVSSAVVDLGPVRRLREWAVAMNEWDAEGSEPSPPMPDGVPEWATEIWPALTFRVCDWVLALKKVPSDQ